MLLDLGHAPVNARLVEVLLQRGMPLEEVWQPSGETALLMAVAYDDVEVRRRVMFDYVSPSHLQEAGMFGFRR